MSGKGKKNFGKTKTTEAYKYPSAYGSHSSMVDAAFKLTDEKLVVCKDDEGHYVTEIKHLDSRLADPNRCATNEFRKKRFKEATE